ESITPRRNATNRDAGKLLPVAAAHSRSAIDGVSFHNLLILLKALLGVGVVVGGFEQVADRVDVLLEIGRAGRRQSLSAAKNRIQGKTEDDEPPGELQPYEVERPAFEPLPAGLPLGRIVRG